MKLKELKHNHSLTDLLKVLIFSILMITPLLSVATRCLYVICNKNAYQSAEITQTTYNRIPKYEYGDVAYTDIDTGKLYEIDFNNNTTDECFDMLSADYSLVMVPIQIYSYDFSNYEFNSYDLVLSNAFLSNQNIVSLKIGLQDTYTSFEFFLCGNDVNDYFIELETISLIEEPFTFHAIVYFDIVRDIELYSDQTLIKNTTYQEYNYEEVESTTLDNVFEYSVNKLAESPILSWTQQTAIYTGVNTMTTQLGVNTPTIPMLIVYWFLLTVIYIIIDIIIKLFTWLTHMIGSKSV